MYQLEREDLPRGPRERPSSGPLELLGQLIGLIVAEARRHDERRAAAGLPPEFFD